MFNIFREFFKKPKETVVIAQLVDEEWNVFKQTLDYECPQHIIKQNSVYDIEIWWRHILKWVEIFEYSVNFSSGFSRNWQKIVKNGKFSVKIHHKGGYNGNCR